MDYDKRQVEFVGIELVDLKKVNYMQHRLQIIQKLEFYMEHQYVIQDKDGQIGLTDSISADLTIVEFLHSIVFEGHKTC